MSLKSFREFLTESSLSRVWQHNRDHDCGGITAYRKARSCGTGERYTHSENEDRNRLLQSRLQSAGYGVTSVLGRSQESGVTVTERSFFVVDLNDTGNLRSDLERWGEEFDQDSVLFAPKGSVNGAAHAILIGTNNCPGNPLAGGGTENFNAVHFGRMGQYYTTYVDGRPFFFEEFESAFMMPGNLMGRWAVRLFAARPVKK